MKLEYFELSIGGIIQRFFLLMAIVIIAGFSGMWWLAAFALPVLLSAMVGVKITSSNRSAKMKSMNREVVSKQMKQAQAA